jgi:large conductance mechanosensitive channel
MAERKRKTSSTQSVTTGTVIRMEEPKSKRQPRPSKAAVVVHEINPVSGFLSFLREYSVVGVAVGFIIALQSQTIMRQLVDSFINPAFGLLFGGQKLSQRTFVVTYHDRTASFGWGIFIFTMINFVFLLLVIYLIIKIFKLDKLAKKAEEKAED